MRVRFLCPECECPSAADLPPSHLWECSACDHRQSLTGATTPTHIPQCVVCGNYELYKKKDFPHALGFVILIIACIASFVTYLYYQVWLTWAILIGTAVFDGILFLLVGDAVVCYRCGAQYRGVERDSKHEPFELGTGEKYRQERIRKEALEMENENR